MKKFQFRLPRLRRRGKILRNLLVTLFLLTLIWGQFGCPLFWPEWEFRRAERRLLLPPSEIVLHLDSFGGRTYREGQSRPILRDDHQFIGVGDGYAITVALKDRPPLFSAPHVYVETWDLSAQEGAVKLITTSSANTYADWRWEDEEGFLSTYLHSIGVVVLDLPAGTVRGELTVKEDGNLYQTDSDVNDAGVCLFSLLTLEGDVTFSYGLPYTLRLYDQDGAVLLEQTGSIPQSDALITIGFRS